MHPVPHQATWKHLDGITFADPTYGQPGRIDALLGVQVYAEIIRRGVWTGPRVVLETTFGWILCGTVKERRSPEHMCTHVVDRWSAKKLLVNRASRPSDDDSRGMRSHEAL